MSSEKSSFLSPVQRRIVAAGGTAVAIVFLAATAYLLFRLLQNFVGTFSNVLLPLAIAAILATLLRPIITFAEERTRLNRAGGIIVLFSLVVGILAAIAVFVVPPLLGTIEEFIDKAPELLNRALDSAKAFAPGIWSWISEQLGESPQELISRTLKGNSDLLQKALSHAQNSTMSIFGFLGSFFGTAAAYSIIPVYLFFILNGDRNIWQDINRQLSFLPDARKDDLVFLAREFSEILISFFRGQIIIGVLLGIVLSIGFGLVGLQFGIAIGFVLGLLNIIPYLGTVLGIIIVVPIAYFQDEGGTGMIVACAIVFIIGQLLTDYVFTPKIMGNKTGMGPMLIIFSVFFWGTALGGLLGMIMAIPLTAFFLVFWRLAREKYLPSLTSKQSSAKSEPAKS